MGYVLAKPAPTSNCICPETCLNRDGSVSLRNALLPAPALVWIANCVYSQDGKKIDRAARGTEARGQRREGKGLKGKRVKGYQVHETSQTTRKPTP